MAKGVYISTCRDEQCRQGWNNQDSKEIQRVGRDTDEDESLTDHTLRNLANDEGKGNNI